MTYNEFIPTVKRSLCPICSEPISDDGCDSNLIYIDKDGVLWEYYSEPWRYRNQTVACRGKHHFRVNDGRLDKHIDELDGIGRGWILHDLEGIGK